MSLFYYCEKCVYFYEFPDDWEKLNETFSLENNVT